MSDHTTGRTITCKQGITGTGMIAYPCLRGKLCYDILQGKLTTFAFYFCYKIIRYLLLCSTQSKFEIETKYGFHSEIT